MRKFCFLLIAMVFYIVQPLSAQPLGGQFEPLQYSEHTYSIKMGDANYTPVWGIYVAGTTVGDIENNLATPVTGFQVLSSTKDVSAGIAYYKVRFASGNVAMPLGNYVIGYKEITNDTKLCTKAVVQGIQLYGPFDVDIALNVGESSEACPDESVAGTWEYDAISQTTVQYSVWIQYPADNPGYIATGGDQKWKFNFTVKATGISGGNATINSIAVAATGLTVTPTFNLSAKPSTFDGFCEVSPSNITPLIFTVVYNDKLGVAQNISFELKSIFGAYNEPDIDETTGNLIGNNIVTHTIYSMPDVGVIMAWGP